MPDGPMLGEAIQFPEMRVDAERGIENLCRSDGSKWFSNPTYPSVEFNVRVNIICPYR